jgi:hypothetical protein
MQTQELTSLLSFVRENGRICPSPQKWNELWELLPGRRRAGAGWEPPPPLILAVWDHTTDIEKRERFALHFTWAAQRNALEGVAQFLNALTPEQWHCGS